MSLEIRHVLYSEIELRTLSNVGLDTLGDSADKRQHVRLANRARLRKDTGLEESAYCLRGTTAEVQQGAVPDRVLDYERARVGWEPFLNATSMCERSNRIVDVAREKQLAADLLRADGALETLRGPYFPRNALE